MRKKRIRTIAGLQRACRAHKNRNARLYKRLYLLEPALRRHLDKLESVNQIADPLHRYQAFREVPALDYEFEVENARLTPQQRTSSAQRDRARRARVRLTKEGETLESLVFELLTQFEDPWQLRAKELWSPMFRLFQERGLNPEFRSAHDGIHEKIEYDHGISRRSFGQGQFANIVSRVRRRIVPTHTKVTAFG